MTTGDQCRLVTWNLWWPSPGSQRGQRILSCLDEQHADVIVETETNEELRRGRTDHGYLVSGGSDWGYPRKAGRRKVAMWSRSPWRDVERDPDPRMPPGRFVSATTDTPVGAVRFIGVCIPWRDAHVRTGRRDAETWGEHLAYLEALESTLSDEQPPVVLVGDFNQRMPRVRQPARVHQSLIETLGGLELATSGMVDGSRLIDHVATSSDLDATVERTLPSEDTAGRLSDHTGVTVVLTRSV